MSELSDAIAAASEAHEADIYFYSGPIDDSGFGALASAVSRVLITGEARNRAILILVTNGGSAGPGYQIARLFQKTYDDFWLCCPSRCKSAGTLIALGASGLIMDSFSELGPLDVQLLKEDEIGSRKSGLLARATFEALRDEAFELYSSLMFNIKIASASLVSFRLASKLASDMTTNLLAKVYGQISPDIVGSEQRDLDVAVHYGRRLGMYGGNINDHTVEHFVKHYPSHDFIIDDDEARNWFDRVDTPSPELYSLIAHIGAPAYDEAETPVVCAFQIADSDSESAAEDGINEQDQHNDEGSGADANGTAALERDRAPNRAGDSGQTRASVSRRSRSGANGEAMRGSKEQDVTDS